MSATIPNFEYDIFISYRHNDNLDGWVTEFVQNLERELRGTIKDSVTIYFDRNPHDGLLEAHHVDKSLEGKLKCLIFIPIISQTYCDKKSFAWQHEFCAFNRLVQEDLFGRDVKLINGNVSSRILPIKIHDIDTEDKALIESEIGGVLRAIEFIYKEAGVNRPLIATDSKNDNQCKTDYRNQLNKVANAIKEIINSLKNPIASPQQLTFNEVPITKKTTSAKPLLAIIVASIIMLVMAGYSIYTTLSPPKNEAELLDKSIAVLPFVDLSESKDQGWFADGLTEEILNSLTHVEMLKVVSRTSSFAFKNKNLRVQVIADSLHVNYVVEGSVRKSEQGLRITAQLIRAEDGFHIWSNTYDRNSKDIFVVQQDIAAKIAQSLNISLDEKTLNQMQWAGTRNAEAYLAFLKGRELDELAHATGDFISLRLLKEANVYYDEALTFDPDFINPYLYHADFFLHYILGDDPDYNDTLTHPLAYKYFMRDLENTVQHSKTESQKNYYSISQILHSSDWTNLRDVIEKSLSSNEAEKLFAYQNFDIGTILVALGYGHQLSEIETRMAIKENQNSSRGGHRRIAALVYEGKYNEALTEISKMDSYSKQMTDPYRVFSFYQLGRLDEASEWLTKMDSSSTKEYYDLKAMILMAKGRKAEAIKVIDSNHSHRMMYLFGVDKVFGRQSANKLAALMDKKLLLDFPLFTSYAMSPVNPPFDFSATPNFASKLRQAGVDINQNQ